MKILVLGLGNPLLGDDGMGPRVISYLKQTEKLPVGVEAVEAGGSYYSYWDKLIQCRHVIAVDSLIGGGQPGSIYFFGPEDLMCSNRSAGITHELHFLDVCNMAAFFGPRPEITIIGVEPEEISFSLELTPLIENKIPQIAAVVQEQILKLMFKDSGVYDEQ